MTDAIVFEKKSAVYTNSLIIADRSGSQHESVVRMIIGNIEDFEDFGQIEFTDLKSGKRGRPTRVYSLNKHQATLLLTFLNNTDPVKKFKKELVKAFFEMESLIKSLLEAKTDFPEFTDAIMAAHEEPKHYHFSNELDMINRIVMGQSAKQYREAHGLESGKSIRPYLTLQQMSAVKALQRIDIGLIITIPSYEQRKGILEQQFLRIGQRKLTA